MEKYSKNTKRHLQAFLRQWLQERDPDETLIINSDCLILQGKTGIYEIGMNEVLYTNDTLLGKCIQDLKRAGVSIIPMPNYLEQDDDQRLETLLQITQLSSFQQRKTIHRLETFFYIGEVLAHRGWQRKDYHRIRSMFSTNKGANDFRKTARRTFELFNARGLANLYAVEHIRPYHLTQMEEHEFYGILLPLARKLHEDEELALV